MAWLKRIAAQGADHSGGDSRIRAANLCGAAALCVDCPLLGEAGFVELREIRAIGGQAEAI